MRARVLLVSGAVAVAVSIAGAVESRSPRAAASYEVNVFIDCVPNGLKFELSPWSVTVGPDDSLSWRLDSRSTVDSMSVVETKGKWPFKSKPPYKVTKEQAKGAKDRDHAQKAGKYKYAIQAMCLRSGGVADTVLIDPDMIIVGD